MASKFYSKCKKNGSESYPSPLSSIENKNGWSYSSFPPIRLHGVDMVCTVPCTNFCALLRVFFSNDKDGDDDDIW
jgi:hypothetical protein